MIVVPAGSFTMGSPATERGRNGDEGPQHRVSFARPFAVGKFAVTFDQWEACLREGGCNRYRPADEGWGRGKRPVINVNWDDAKAYVAWLSRKTGKNYRLLSEAEREYVTRAGTTTPFWWGTSVAIDNARYDVFRGVGTHYSTDRRGPPDRIRGTVPVESFDANYFGLYQVHGNVWDWTEDCWNDSYRGAPADGSVRTSGICERRVVRGGSWIALPGELRAALRSYNDKGNRSNDVGLRVARSLD
jgi:formylglycine-generating enzyme required for sulfatase activity